MEMAVEMVIKSKRYDIRTYHSILKIDGKKKSVLAFQPISFQDEILAYELKKLFGLNPPQLYWFTSDVSLEDHYKRVKGIRYCFYEFQEDFAYFPLQYTKPKYKNLDDEAKMLLLYRHLIGSKNTLRTIGKIDGIWITFRDVCEPYRMKKYPAWCCRDILEEGEMNKYACMKRGVKLHDIERVIGIVYPEKECHTDILWQKLTGWSVL